MQLKRHLKFLLLGFAFILFIPQGVAHAAGSAVVTVESSGSVVAGSDITLRFYLTPSGANAYSTEVNVSLTNLSVVTGSASGTAFGGFAGFTTGGTIGSNSFSLAGSSSGPTGPSAGVSGKSLIYTVTVRATNAATGTVTLGGAAAYDGNLEAMSASSQNHSVSITCPSGQTGTPPNCTTPTPPPSGGSGGSGGGSGGGTTTPPPSSPGTTPSSPNTQAVANPNGDTSDPVIVDESEVAILASDEYMGKTEADLITETVATTKSKLPKFSRTIILSLIAVLALLGAVVLLMKAKMARKAHQLSNITSTSVSTTITPSNQPGDNADKSKDNGNGPTIIHPQK